MDKNLKIFISYAHKDKVFANKLDAMLNLAGITTFVDEKDILIGDSIPSSIHKGILESDHFVCVLSNNSIGSKWVKEELESAIMRKNDAEGYKVIPALIDDINIPSTLKHVKCADFVGWEDHDKFRKSFILVMKSIGIMPLSFSRIDIEWYASNRKKISNYIRFFASCYSELFGAFSAQQSVGLQQWPAWDTVAKSYFYDPSMVVQINEMLKELFNKDDQIRGDKIIKIKNTLVELKDMAANLERGGKFWTSFDPERKVSEFMWKAYAISSMFEEMRFEFEEAILSRYTWPGDSEA